LKETYSEEAPVHIVYRDGYIGSEKIIRTDINNVEGIINVEKEKHLFLLFMGPCLNTASNVQEH
jgi:hypothetical protein